jgi:hypothetical protein
MVIARITGVCHKFQIDDSESDTSCVTESSAVLVTVEKHEHTGCTHRILAAVSSYQC